MPKKPTNKDLQEQIDTLTQDLQRSRAELINYKRRTEEEKAILMTTAKASVIGDLLGVIVNLDRALSHQPKELESNPWAKGVVGVAKQLQDTLNKMGVKRINANPGTPFDANLHEAIMMEESEGEGDQEVIAQEMQPGYEINGQVVRHSIVKVTLK